MNRTKKLTIAIPNYNDGKYLKETILSCKNIALLEQDYEILVVDNLSTDDSIPIVKGLMEKMPNIRMVVNEHNLGRLGNWKKCITEARGEYFNFLFTTNEFLPGNRLEYLIRVLDSNDDVSLCVSTYIGEMKEGFFKKSESYFSGECEFNTSEFIDGRLEQGKMINGFLQGNLFRTSDIKELDFDESCPFCADHIFTGNAMLKRKLGFFHDTPRILWRIWVNPKRFHANITIEDLFLNHFQAAKSLRQLTGHNIRLHNFLANQLEIILSHRIFFPHLISPKSDYARAVRILIQKGRDENVSALSLLSAFLLNISKKSLVFLTKLSWLSRDHNLDWPEPNINKKHNSFAKKT